MWTRRGVLGGGLAAVALVGRARAQPAGRLSSVGVLTPTARRLGVEDTFEEALRDAGWVKGKNLRIEIRAPTGADVLIGPALADLIALAPDVIVVWGTVGALAAKQATTRIPVVFLATGDPVGLALVSSLAHPGGNLTGIAAIASSEEFAKRLALLKDIVPSATQVAVLLGSDGRALLNLNRANLLGTAGPLGLELFEIVAERAEALDAVLRDAKARGAQALYVWPSGFTLAAGSRIAALALANRLPSVHPFTESAVAGGLFSYAASLSHIAKRGAVYVDKILRGTPPADLPVEQPTTFELVINVKTARALALTIPPSLLARADQIIQ